MSLINATKMSRVRRNATENPFIIHQGAPKRGEIYDRILEKMIQMTDRPLKRRNISKGTFSRLQKGAELARHSA